LSRNTRSRWLQVHAALRYAHENLAEIEAVLAEDDRTAERIVHDREEFLKRSVWRASVGSLHGRADPRRS